ncbi:MAG: galactokinase [Acidobacteriota bacterium]
MREILLERFAERFNRAAEWWVQAPGRVNLIGEHTDYNDGFVFPAAIDRYLHIAAAPRDDDRIRAYSVDFDQESTFPIDDPEYSREAAWSNYLRGVVQQIRRRGLALRGMDLVLSGNVPVGAGLSSSAALEVATAETVRAVSGLELDRVQMALLCQAAEREFVGVNCGIMDQFVSALAQPDAALFIDCRDLTHEPVPLAPGVSLVVCDSKVQRKLDASAYNQRRRECEEAVAALRQALPGIRALRDVTPEQLEAHRDLLDDVHYRRARHVVTENDRVLQAVELLRRGELEAFGSLLYASHTSLRQDYEVSCRELDVLVDLAGQVPGTLGARMTGAGFGGCTVNLVRSEAVEEFRFRVASGYRAEVGHDCAVYACRASRGAWSERL